MPVIHFHLENNKYSQEQCEELMIKASEIYCSVLYNTTEEEFMSRVRIFLQFYPSWGMATSGTPISRGGANAPYFDFIVLEGRPIDEIQELIEGFTDLLVDLLGAERSLIRGACWPVTPEHWGIGGVPASVLRSKEIVSRKQ